MKEIKNLIRDLYFYEIQDIADISKKNAHAIVNPLVNIPNEIKDSLVILIACRITKDSITYILAGYNIDNNGKYYDISYLITGDNLPSFEEIVNTCKPIEIKKEWKLTPSIYKGSYFKENNVWKNYQNAPLIKRSYIYSPIDKKNKRFINFFENDNILKQTDSIYVNKRINKSICLFVKS